MGILRKIRHTLPGAVGRKNFHGNLFDRFEGLDPLLRQANGLSLLDVGMSEGHIAYEFARRGARLIHGMDKHWDKVRFARRLFRDVPIPHGFWRTDLSKSGELPAVGTGELLEQYDLVLFLGVYHHIRKDMPQERLDALVDSLLDRTAKLIAVRTDQLPDFAPQIEKRGFELDYAAPKEKIGLLHVYRRSGAPV